MDWVRLLFLPALFLFAVIDNPTPTLEIPPAQALSTACRNAVTGIWELKADLEYPEHLMQPDSVKTEDDFDVNQYWTVLDHLSMRSGYVLDYVYQYDGMGGYPVLYARPAQAAPYKTYSEYQAAMEKTPEPDGAGLFTDYIELDGTAESYIQLAVLQVMANQFYLFWHANYNDLTIICDTESLETLVSQPDDFGNDLPRDVQRAARALDPAPALETGRDTVKVELLTFSKWGGFGRLTYKFSRELPHRVEAREGEILVPYDCGVMF